MLNSSVERNEGNEQCQAHENCTERRIAMKVDEEKAVSADCKSAVCYMLTRVPTFTSQQFSEVDLIIPDLWRRKQFMGKLNGSSRAT